MERRGNKGYRNQRYVDVNKVYQKHQIHQGQMKLQQNFKSPELDDFVQLDLKLKYRARIIGERGVILNELTKQCGCKVDVPKATDRSSPVKVTGNVSQVLKAIGIICVLCKEKQTSIDTTVIFKQSFIQSNFKTQEDVQKKKVLSDVELRVRGFVETDFQLGTCNLFAPKDKAGLFRVSTLQKPQDLEFSPEELQELSIQSNSLIWCDNDVHNLADIVLKNAAEPVPLQNVFVVSTTFEDAAKASDMIRQLIKTKLPEITPSISFDCSKYVSHQSPINNNVNNNTPNPPHYSHTIVSSYSYLSKHKLQIPAKIRMYRPCNLPLNVDIVNHLVESISVDGCWPLTPRLLALLDVEYDVVMESIEEISNTVPTLAALESLQKSSAMATCLVIQFLRQAKASQLERNSYFEVDTQRVEFIVNRALSWLASLQIKGDQPLDELTKKASSLLESEIGSKLSKSLEPTLISLLHSPHGIFSKAANDNTDVTFLSYRNNFESIVLTPYRDSKWAMEVFRYGNVILLFPSRTRADISGPQFDGYPQFLSFSFENLP